jgi:hypothetical protein
LRSSSLYGSLHLPVTSSVLGEDIPLTALFSNTFGLCSCLNVKHPASHSYRTTGKIIFQYVSFLMFVDSDENPSSFLLILS